MAVGTLFRVGLATEILMNRKVRWGILSTAGIAVNKVIPAMQQGDWSEVLAIASRDINKATRVAQQLGIPKAYGSYEELLTDDEVEAIYNPLPNHLHVPWTIRAAECGKHVLCEKPIALNREEAAQLLAVRDRTGMKIQEAYMVKTHPQWIGALELVKSGRIGELRAINGFFSYFNSDPKNIRNKKEIGGGGLMDVGGYPTTIARFLFGEEPHRVIGLIERDEHLGIDRLTSALLDFPAGQASFTCGTQIVPYQRMQLCGTRGRIEVEIPFNAPADKPTRLFIHDGSNLAGDNAEVIEFPACDQYTIQGDLFSRAIIENSAQAVPLEDAVKNMAVIDALFRSESSDGWETV
jgi:predicted dehydrogenase